MNCVNNLVKGVCLFPVLCVHLYRNLFAFSTSDKLVHIYKFATKRERLELVATLSGHTDEVTQVRWNWFTEKWVTASEDGTIRTWVGLYI